ncbi:extracellular solute-binding protein [Aureimonas leprariae]|uniref:extracellular solute-binding protein n=1 Tax=Plantimonas leprariae TaxID=2615207 RepID=UPI00192A3B59|nr:extracellular solute-binding protein [Aureimonas leprariae]
MTAFSFSRRRFGQFVLALGGAAALPAELFAQTPADTPVHGLSAFGDLKYAADFKAFAYANPDAPSGGRMAMSAPNWTLNQSTQTFDTFNTFVLQGNAPPRIEMLYDSLMVSSLDEPASFYGALAESVSVSPDRNAFTFRLRREARFSNGAPVTAADVAFSYQSFKDKGHPALAIALADMKEATAEGDGTVRLVFTSGKAFVDVLSVLAFPIVEAAHFASRDFASGGFEPIPGSGRYAVGRFAAGNFIEYEKRADYWAKDMPFARGLDHFQTIRLAFFRDRQVDLENFKRGDSHYREEATSKSWATEYDFPAVREKKVVKRAFEREKSASFQCWALNQRRERFRDARVRRAINLCFDFEWTNAKVFYELYKHSDSCFENSDFKAVGRPGPEELAILEALRGKVPDEVFGDVWTQPVSDGSGNDRRKLREAYELLQAAGWTQRNGRLVNAAGEPFALEYLIDDPGFERVYAKFIENCRRLGIDARIRLVDASQYQNRQNGFDYDMIGSAMSLGSTPTRDTLIGLFGSETRDRPGSYNLVGMGDPAVDNLIDTVVAAKSREAMTLAMRCLDRVLRARLDWIPNIHSDEHRVAYWDRFGFREPKPEYGLGFPVESLWWYDEAKAKSIGRT